MFMNTIKHTAGIKSKQNQDEPKYVNVGNEFAWLYAFGKDAAWNERELIRVVNTLRLKRTKWFYIPVRHTGNTTQHGIGYACVHTAKHKANLYLR